MSDITLQTNRLLSIPSMENWILSNKSKECFTRKRNEGHPWSLGFFVLVHYLYHVQPNRPFETIHVQGFTHKGWIGHPYKCEKMATAELVRSGLVTKH